MLAIQNRYGYEISYDMAWRAKQLALEKRFDNYKDSYRRHVLMLDQRCLQQAIVWLDNSGYEVALSTWHMTMNTPSTT